jgi:hypothetical protein
VYATHSSVNRWRAKVKMGGYLREVGRAAYPHQAAVYVVQWYRKMYGDNWVQEIDRRRNKKTWSILHSDFSGWVSWQACYNSEDDGWTLWVWEWGERVCVREVKRNKEWVIPRPSRLRKGVKPKGRPKLFASKEEAKRYVNKWMVRRWGLLAFIAARRF